MRNYGSITSKDVLISHDEYLKGKYQSVSTISGKHYARVWYIGDEINPTQTYTERYCKQHGLGKYAKETSSSSSSTKTSKKSSGSSLGSAIGGGVAGMAKKFFEESPEKKAEREASIEEDSRIQEIVDKNIDRLKGELKYKYPLDTRNATTMLGYITALHEDIIRNKDISKSGDDFNSKLAHRLESEQLECKGKYLRKLLKAFKKKTEFKTFSKDAEKYSGRRNTKQMIFLMIAIVIGCLIILGQA